MNESWDDALKCFTELSDGVSYHKKMIGYTSDGKSLNRDCIQSVRTVLRKKLPCIHLVYFSSSGAAFKRCCKRHTFQRS